METPEQFQEIFEKSKVRPQVIFKHSTRCSVSKMVKNRLEKSEGQDNFDFYYLDLLKFRSLSNQIAGELKIPHESPQIIVIKGGKPVYNEDHSAIYMDDIIAKAI